MREIIQTEHAPIAVGPYSQAVKQNNILFCSGQIPIDPTTGEIVGTTIIEQTHQVFKNIQAVLEAGKCNFNHVIKTTCLLTDMDDFTTFNEIYAQYFKDSFPARSTFAVKALPKNVLVEVEVIAIAD